MLTRKAKINFSEYCFPQVKVVNEGPVRCSAHSESFLHMLLVFAFSYLCLQVSQHSAFILKVLWTLWERERVGRFGRMALKHV